MICESVPEVLKAQVTLSDCGCWNWTGRQLKKYGVLIAEGKTVGAHRFAYEVLNGKIPPGLVIDHLCRNTTCVNPAHLEPVTQLENIRRGDLMKGRGPSLLLTQPREARSVCERGHPFVEGNIYYSPNNERECRICRRARKKRHKERHRVSIG